MSCIGITQKELRCHYKQVDGQYCRIHARINARVRVHVCKGKVKYGRQCTRKIKNGDYCYQHRPRDNEGLANHEAYGLRERPEEKKEEIKEKDPFRCHAWAEKGNRCVRRPTAGKKYCHKHEYQYRLERPDECPVCTECLSEQEMPLSCGHWICEACVKKLSYAVCPMCRSNLQIPADVQDMITQNRRRRRNEDINEEHRYLQQLNAQVYIDLDFQQHLPILQQRLDALRGALNYMNIRLGNHHHH